MTIPFSLLKKIGLYIFILSFSVISMSCMRYLTFNRDEALLTGIDMEATLKIAELELSQDKWGRSLTIWVIKDQVITPDEARKISTLYFKWIGAIDRQFDIWHLTWAIGNLYKLGDKEVQAILEEAYFNAKTRARKASNRANRFINNEKIWMGDAHSGGRAYARRHIVIPGNKKYLQSFEEYLEKNE